MPCVDLVHGIEAYPAARSKVVVMTAIHFEANISDDERRPRLYNGELFVYAPTAESLDLIEFARKMLTEAFAPSDPELDDVATLRGARNVDSRCTGTTMGDYLRCSDLAHLPAAAMAPYDSGPPQAALS
jgi:hypothetical protein